MNTRTSVLTIGLLCLWVQALIPAGFMPGRIADGAWIQLCPSGLPRGFIEYLAGDHAHHHHHHGAHHSEDAPPVGHCDLNVPLDAAPALAVPSAPAIVASGHKPPAMLPDLLATGTRSAYRARAPPIPHLA